MKQMKLLALSLFCFTAISGIGTAALAAEKVEGVHLQLETVALATWERVQGAFTYQVEADGVALGSQVGGRNYFAHDGPFENVKIRAFSFRGEPVGEPQLKFQSLERHERLVLRWDEKASKAPYVGVMSGPDGSTKRTTLELKQSPHVIWDEPGTIKRVLFGERVAPKEGRKIHSPFELERGRVIEHGPYIELPLP